MTDFLHLLLQAILKLKRFYTLYNRADFEQYFETISPFTRETRLVNRRGYDIILIKEIAQRSCMCIKYFLPCLGTLIHIILNAIEADYNQLSK